MAFRLYYAILRQNSVSYFTLRGMPWANLHPESHLSRDAQVENRAVHRLAQKECFCVARRN